jgi:sulfur-oxidizing protein SoxY
MDRNRREFIRAGGVLGLMVAAGLLTAEQAQAQQAAWNKAAFDTKSVDDTVKALGGTSAAQSGDIAITAPDIAENGAVVPVGVTSKIPNVATRIKMGQTSNVYAVVKADNKFYTASKEVKVTLGGCGG